MVEPAQSLVGLADQRIGPGHEVRPTRPSRTPPRPEVGSPELLEVRCKSVEEMRLVNLLCHLLQYAEES